MTRLAFEFSIHYFLQSKKRTQYGYDKIARAWRRSSRDDIQVAHSLFEKGHYTHSLFFCHLAVEKELKRVYLLRRNQLPPFIHNLIRIAEQCELQLDESFRKDLQELTTFNIKARYEITRAQFHRKATKAFTRKWLNRTEQILKFLKKKQVTRTVRSQVEDFLIHLRKQGLSIEKAFIFGSQSVDKSHRWSDIDVCIVSRDFGPQNDALTYLWRALRKQDVKAGIEPVGFHPDDFVEDLPLVHEILRHGVRVI